MKMHTSPTAARAWLCAALLAFTATAVMAEKPEWAGKGKREDREDRRDSDRGGNQQRDDRYGRQGPSVQVRVGGYFHDRQRNEAHGYYREQYQSGKCPPGLAKKNNGCMPPGQARKWNMGQPLPRDVQYYPVEPSVRARLGVPPAGHEFVRVASDILMIAVGTSMVVDAIQDLGGR